MVYDGDANVYFIGGCGKAFDRLNIQTLEWAQLPDALEERYCSAVFITSDKKHIYVVGGLEDSMEYFDIAQNQWQIVNITTKLTLRNSRLAISAYRFPVPGLDENEVLIISQKDKEIRVFNIK